jgi:hypothetical protein
MIPNPPPPTPPDDSPCPDHTVCDEATLSISNDFFYLLIIVFIVYIAWRKYNMYNSY